MTAFRFARLTAGSGKYQGKTLTLEGGAVTKAYEKPAYEWKPSAQECANLAGLHSIIRDWPMGCVLVTGLPFREGERIRRTKEDLRHDGPGVLVIDYDEIPELARQHGRAAPQTLAEVVAEVRGIHPALTDVGFVASSSSSSFVNDGPLKGAHLFALLDQTEETRGVLARLHRAAIARGWGRWYVSRAGVLLDRSVVDRAMSTPNQPCFEGKPKCGEGVCVVRKVEIFEGVPLEAARVVEADRDRRAAPRIKAGWRDLPEVRALVAKMTEAHVERLQKRGMNRERAHKFLRALQDGGRASLPYDVPVILDDGVELTVGDIVAAGDAYHERHCCDPSFEEEGPKAIIYTKTQAGVACRPIIHSYAHGPHTYELEAIPRERPREWVQYRQAERTEPAAEVTRDEAREMLAGCLRDALRARGRCTIIKAPCGAGKTYSTARGLEVTRQRFVWLSPNYQTLKAGATEYAKACGHSLEDAIRAGVLALVPGPAEHDDMPIRFSCPNKDARDAEAAGGWSTGVVCAKCKDESCALKAVKAGLKAEPPRAVFMHSGHLCAGGWTPTGSRIWDAAVVVLDEDCTPDIQREVRLPLQDLHHLAFRTADCYSKKKKRKTKWRSAEENQAAHEENVRLWAVMLGALYRKIPRAIAEGEAREVDLGEWVPHELLTKWDACEKGVEPPAGFEEVCREHGPNTAGRVLALALARVDHVLVTHDADRRVVIVGHYPTPALAGKTVIVTDATASEARWRRALEVAGVHHVRVELVPGIPPEVEVAHLFGSHWTRQRMTRGRKDDEKADRAEKALQKLASAANALLLRGRHDGGVVITYKSIDGEDFAPILRPMLPWCVFVEGCHFGGNTNGHDLVGDRIRANGWEAAALFVIGEPRVPVFDLRLEGFRRGIHGAIPAAVDFKARPDAGWRPYGVAGHDLRAACAYDAEDWDGLAEEILTREIMQAAGRGYPRGVTTYLLNNVPLLDLPARTERRPLLEVVGPLRESAHRLAMMRRVKGPPPTGGWTAAALAADVGASGGHGLTLARVVLECV